MNRVTVESAVEAPGIGLSSNLQFKPSLSRFLLWIARVVPTRPHERQLLRLRDKLSLGPRKWLVVVEYRDKELLFISSGDLITPVTCEKQTSLKSSRRGNVNRQIEPRNRPS